MSHWSRSEKRRAVDAVPAWYHSFDFGDGLTASGVVTLEGIRHQASLLHDVRGKSVVDRQHL
jgi:hypothetical protein